MKLKQYFIVSKHLDTFIISVEQKDRLNNINDDEVIQKFMSDNYNGYDEYESIEININDYENIIL